VALLLELVQVGAVGDQLLLAVGGPQPARLEHHQDSVPLALSQPFSPTLEHAHI
jgi:hypothetical protein